MARSMININSELREKITHVFRITLSHIHNIKVTRIIKLLINIIKRKSNNNLLRSFLPSFHSNVKNEISCIRHTFIKNFTFIITEVFIFLFSKFLVRLIEGTQQNGSFISLFQTCTIITVPPIIFYFKS